MLLYTRRPCNKANSSHWTLPAPYDWRDITRLIAAAAAPALLSAKLIHGEYISECLLQGHKVQQEQCRGTEPSSQQQCSRLLSLPANNSSHPPLFSKTNMSTGERWRSREQRRSPCRADNITGVLCRQMTVHSFGFGPVVKRQTLTWQPDFFVASDVDVHSSKLPGRSTLYPSVIKAKFIT